MKQAAVKNRLYELPCLKLYGIVVRISGEGQVNDCLI
jgi:hypothetical protein